MTILCALIVGLAISNLIMVSMLRELKDKFDVVEERCNIELESFRERVKAMEREQL